MISTDRLKGKKMFGYTNYSVCTAALKQSHYVIPDQIFYIFPFITLFIRACIYTIYHRKMDIEVSETEKARDTYRSLLYAYLAVSFAALLALTIANAKSDINLKAAVFCSVFSFIGFYLSLSLQSFKANLKDALIADGLMDNSKYCLLATIVAVVNDKYGITEYSIVIIILMILPYLCEETIKLRKMISYIKAR